MPAGLESLGFPAGTATPDAVGRGVSQPPTGPATEQPGEGDYDEGEEPGEGKGHTDKGKSKGKGHKDKGHKDKEHKGKAKGHSKDKAHGEAKGHGKWQGRADVAFAPRGAKPSHVRSPGAERHARRSPHSHPRPRR